MADNNFQINIELSSNLSGGVAATEQVKKLTGAGQQANAAFTDLNAALAASVLGELKADSEAAAKAQKELAAAEKVVADEARKAAEAEGRLAEAARQVRENVDLSTNRTLAYEQTVANATKGNQAFASSKQRIKEGLKGLAMEFPVLGRAAQLFLTPITAALAGAAGVFALVRSEITKFEEAIEDAASTTKFQESIKAQAEAVKALRAELDLTKAQLDTFTGWADDPERQANFKAAAFRGDARREGEADAADVAAGLMTKEQAEQRAAARADRLAGNLNMVEEERVGNTSIQFGVARKEYEQKASEVAGMKTPEAAKQELADFEARLQAERDSLAKLQAEAERLKGNPLRFGDAYAMEQRARDKAGIIAGMEGELPGREQSAASAAQAFAVAAAERDRLRQRAEALRQRGQEDVFTRPAARAEFEADQSARRSNQAVSTATPEQLQQAIAAALKNHTDVVVELIRVQSQRLKSQRTP